MLPGAVTIIISVLPEAVTIIISVLPEAVTIIISVLTEAVANGDISHWMDLAPKMKKGRCGRDNTWS